MAARSDLVVSTGFPARYAPASSPESLTLDDLPAHPACGTIVRSALLWTVAGIGFVMAWSSLVPLQSAVVASAVVAVESSRKPVQSQTGGTIKRLLVKEGATVQSGDVLLEFDRVQTAVEHDALDKQYLKGLVRRARLQAEAAGLTAIVWPPEIEARRDEPVVADLMAIEEPLFEARSREYQGRRDITERRIAELREEIAAYDSSLKAVVEQVALIREEQESVRILLDKGLERKPRMLALQRTAAALLGERGQLRANERRSRQSLEAAILEFANLEYERRSRVIEELTTVEATLNELAERRKGARQILENTVVRAGEDGFVVDLKFFGPGAVVAPGEPILDIVPRGDSKILIAQIRPSDIDMVRVGQAAEVRLLAYDMRNVEPLDGRVLTVSADRLIDESTRQAYFETRVAVDEQSLARQPDIELYPGMPADVVIKTGERTVLEYLTKPVTRYLFTSFREE
ncbi:MAG: HlyD family type I secretion periplasmic adaptor subunit [Thalassobaculum sp.]|uniref:HlyD family type I secretion periplasmic adaptor subunit n=1 Tax=Thalassobaculum sp. TaxID=2022740 RepID=UPI0032EFFB3B